VVEGRKIQTNKSQEETKEDRELYDDTKDEICSRN
jgi:hypothetical protein